MIAVIVTSVIVSAITAYVVTRIAWHVLGARHGR